MHVCNPRICENGFVLKYIPCVGQDLFTPYFCEKVMSLRTGEFYRKFDCYKNQNYYEN